MNVLIQITERIPKLGGGDLISLKALLLAVIDQIDREIRSRDQERRESRVLRKRTSLTVVQ